MQILTPNPQRMGELDSHLEDELIRFHFCIYKHELPNELNQSVLSLVQCGVTLA